MKLGFGLHGKKDIKEIEESYLIWLLDKCKFNIEIITYELSRRRAERSKLSEGGDFGDPNNPPPREENY